MGRYEFEQFNSSRAWRVRDHEDGIDYLGSYKTMVAKVYNHGERICVELFPASTGYKPTTSKQVTQMLYQWYGINLDARSRAGIERESSPDGEYSGEVFAWYPSFFGRSGKDCDILFSYDMGVHNNASMELFSIDNKMYFVEQIAAVAVNCDKFYC